MIPNRNLQENSFKNYQKRSMTSAFMCLFHSMHQKVHN